MSWEDVQNNSRLLTCFASMILHNKKKAEAEYLSKIDEPLFLKSETFHSARILITFETAPVWNNVKGVLGKTLLQKIQHKYKLVASFQQLLVIVFHIRGNQLCYRYLN